MLTLVCALVGAHGGPFAVRIDEEQSVARLKAVIAEQQKLTVPVNTLRLFLAKGRRDNQRTWLRDDGPLARDLATGRAECPSITAMMDDDDCEMDDEEEASIQEWLDASDMPPPTTTDHQIHLLVVASTSKRLGGGGSFADDPRALKKRTKCNMDTDDGDDVTRYFEMAEFPPVAHPRQRYKKILERDSYVVIFAELMDKVKRCLTARTSANMVVTGTSGIGKSRFYLYCIFRLAVAQNEAVTDLPAFDLVLNFDEHYHLYAPKTKEFVQVSDEEARELADRGNVLRLIDGQSSRLVGWKGVSILFASSGVSDLNRYARVESFTYILPVWTLEELQEYNDLLGADLKVADDLLIARYDKFGGIPRFVFTCTEPENDAQLQRAMATFRAVDMLSFAATSLPVRGGDHSECVLAMVPTARDFRAKYHFDFLSNYIAEKVLGGMSKDDLRKVAKLARVPVTRRFEWALPAQRRIYEVLCHRWFDVHSHGHLRFRSLGSMAKDEWVVVENMPVIRFATLEEIRVLPKCPTYYQPTSRRCGAFDAFILDRSSRCFALRMTLRVDEDVEVCKRIARWFRRLGVPSDRIGVAFVVPTHMATSYPEQMIRIDAEDAATGQTMAQDVKQYVVALDVDLHD